MSKTIFQYTAASTIDATADLLLIEQAVGPIYKSISRNTLLGITGNPIGTTDSQTLSNKTIGNTNTVTLKDTLFTLQDDGDTSKQAKFQLSGITTATTRTYTLPNASSTLADIATAQTFTNKTLTSPTITGGTYDNGTITVDSIGGHTSGTVVTVANLQISNGVLNTNNSVITANITDTAITPAKLQTGTGSSWAWQSWTPAWTNLVVGNGTLNAKYIQAGKTVNFKLDLVFGTTTVISGTVSLTLPVTATTLSGTSGIQSLGQADIYDSGTADYVGVVKWLTTTTIRPETLGVSAALINTLNIVNTTAPMTWTTNDELHLRGFYEAA